MVAAKAYLDELHDKNKASYKYMSSSHSFFSYTHCLDEIKEEMKGKMATNDLAESSFGAVTNQMQTFTRIDIAGAAAVSDLQRNKFLNRDLYLYTCTEMSIIITTKYLNCLHIILCLCACV